MTIELSEYVIDAIADAIVKKMQEPCEDAISRQAVLEQINCWIGSGEYRYTNATHYLTRRMQDLPPVTPQPKTDVLGKIRAEIETKYGQCDICEYFENYDYEENDISEYRPMGNIAEILQIIDKYRDRAESEDK